MKKIYFSVLTIIILSLLAPLAMPHDPFYTDINHLLESPSIEYPLGTDHVGRCILSRLLYGARISLSMTFLLLTIISVLGILLGVFAGYGSKILDTIIMRLSDILLAFPDMVLAITIVGFLGANIYNTILGLSLIWWTKYARLTRILIKKERKNAYVKAGIMGGASAFKIITRYIFPNILSHLLIQFMVDIGGMMLTLSSLSFLGLGIQAPYPEWGNMLYEGRSYIQTAPWLLIAPGLTITSLVYVFNLLGNQLREIIEG